MFSPILMGTKVKERNIVIKRTLRVSDCYVIVFNVRYRYSDKGLS